MLKGKSNLLNKSLVTNLIAAAIIVSGYLSPWFKEQLKTVGFFALSGALTNWLAVIMLFDKVPLLYGSGVIPKHFEDIKTGIKNMIMKEFFTEEKTRAVFGDIKSVLIKEVDFSKAAYKIDYDSLFDTVKDQIFQSKRGGMFSLFGGKNILEKYREPFTDQMRYYIITKLEDPEFLESVFGIGDDQEKLTVHITEKIEEIILIRLDELTPEATKKIVQDMIRRHLGWLVVWGGFFGGLIGLVMSLVP